MVPRRSFLAGLGAVVAGWFGVRAAQASQGEADPFAGFHGEGRSLRMKLYRRTEEEGKRHWLEISLDEARPGDRCVLVQLNAVCLIQATIFTYESHRFDDEGRLYFKWHDVYPLLSAPEGEDYKELVNLHCDQKRRARTLARA